MALYLLLKCAFILIIGNFHDIVISPELMILTQKNRRFLIVWFAILTFALLCNLVPIRGKIRDYQQLDERGKAIPAIFLFTDGNSDDYGFWPFVSYTDNYIGSFAADSIENATDMRVFYGIFHFFGFWEYLIYGAVGLAIVFLPQIWHKK